MIGQGDNLVIGDYNSETYSGPGNPTISPETMGITDILPTTPALTMAESVPVPITDLGTDDNTPTSPATRGVGLPSVIDRTQSASPSQPTQPLPPPDPPLPAEPDSPGRFSYVLFITGAALLTLFFFGFLTVVIMYAYGEFKKDADTQDSDESETIGFLTDYQEDSLVYKDDADPKFDLSLMALLFLLAMFLAFASGFAGWHPIYIR